MDKSFKMHVRLGDIFRIERIIRNVDDVERASNTLLKKLEEHQVMDAILTWKWDGLQSKYWVEGPLSYRDTATLLISDLLRHMLEIGIIDLSHLKQWIKLCEEVVVPPQSEMDF